MTRLFATALVLSAPLAGLAAPAFAQDAPGDKVNQLIVYGDDPCPASTGDEITVCARKAEGERYRIPEDLRESRSVANKSWTERVLAYETVGRNGIMSCSPIGAGGEFGCTQQLIDKAYAEKREGSAVKFGQLIAEKRAERLESVDQEASEEQKRVEELEREYEERKAAEARAEQARQDVIADEIKSGGELPAVEPVE